MTIIENYEQRFKHELSQAQPLQWIEDLYGIDDCENYYELRNINFRYRIDAKEIDQILALPIEAPNEDDYNERIRYKDKMIEMMEIMSTDGFLSRRICYSMPDGNEQYPTCPSLYHYMIREPNVLSVNVYFRSNHIDKFLWDNQTIVYCANEFIRHLDDSELIDEDLKMLDVTVMIASLHEYR